MADSDIVVKNLTKKRLKRLLDMFCVHAKEYHADHFVCHWEKCNACILRDIPWRIPGEISKIQGAIDRDLCFAIWHEGILNA